MLRELYVALKSAGFTVTSLSGGVIVNCPNATITIGHDTSGFSTYVQAGTDEEPTYSGDDSLSKDAVIALCQQYQQVATVAV
jgi:hypothetical protein